MFFERHLFKIFASSNYYLSRKCKRNFLKHADSHCISQQIIHESPKNIKFDVKNIEFDKNAACERKQFKKRTKHFYDMRLTGFRKTPQLPQPTNVALEYHSIYLKRATSWKRGTAIDVCVF